MKKPKKLILRIAIAFGIFFVVMTAVSGIYYYSLSPEERAQYEEEREQREAEKLAQEKAEKEQRAKELAEQKAKEEAEQKAAEQEEAEQKAKEEAQQKAKKEAEEQAAKEKEEAEAKAKAEEQAKKEAEAKEKAQKEADAKVMKDAFNSATKSLADNSNGVIIATRINAETPYLTVETVVSDAWYYSPEHEKQRFADALYSSVYRAAVGSGLIKNGDEMIYDIVDSYGETLAEYSVWSGKMKIKK